MNIIKSLTAAVIAVLTVTIALATGTPASIGDKVEGYIIQDNGKKIEGKIIIGSITDNEISVSFIPNGKSKKVVYTPKDLQAYGYQEVDIDDMGRKVNKWVYYERQKADIPPKPFGSTQVFMQKEVEGAIELFSYYVETKNDPSRPYQYFYYIKIDDKVTKVSNETFERTSKSIFRDYTALYTKLENGELTYRNLDQLILDYNFWLVNKHDKNEYRMAMKNDDETRATENPKDFDDIDFDEVDTEQY